MRLRAGSLRLRELQRVAKAGGLYRSHTSSAEALSASTATAAEARSCMVVDSIDRCDGRLQDRPFTVAADLSMNLVDAALGGPKP